MEKMVGDANELDRSRNRESTSTRGSDGILTILASSFCEISARICGSVPTSENWRRRNLPNGLFDHLAAVDNLNGPSSGTHVFVIGVDGKGSTNRSKEILLGDRSVLDAVPPF